jgi:hypothetical protein
MASAGCLRHSPRSYSDHDTKKCGASSFDWDNIEILMTALLVWNFVFTFLNVLRSVDPAVMLFQSFIYAFGCFSVAVFFYVFHRAQ